MHRVGGVALVLDYLTPLALLSMLVIVADAISDRVKEMLAAPQKDTWRALALVVVYVVAAAGILSVLGCLDRGVASDRARLVSARMNTQQGATWAEAVLGELPMCSPVEEGVPLLGALWPLGGLWGDTQQPGVPHDQPLQSRCASNTVVTQASMDKIMNLLTADEELDRLFQLRARLVDSDDPFAAALPDGTILVSTAVEGAWVYNTGDLAALLAHEIGHVLERHGAEMRLFGATASVPVDGGASWTDWVQAQLLQVQELEADVWAVLLLRRAKQRASLRNSGVVRGVGNLERLVNATTPPREFQGGAFHAATLHSMPTRHRRLDNIRSVAGKFGDGTAHEGRPRMRRLASIASGPLATLLSDAYDAHDQRLGALHALMPLPSSVLLAMIAVHQALQVLQHPHCGVPFWVLGLLAFGYSVLAVVAMTPALHGLECDYLLRVWVTYHAFATGFLYLNPEQFGWREGAASTVRGVVWSLCVVYLGPLAWFTCFGTAPTELERVLMAGTTKHAASVQVLDGFGRMWAGAVSFKMLTARGPHFVTAKVVLVDAPGNDGDSFDVRLADGQDAAVVRAATERHVTSMPSLVRLLLVDTMEHDRNSQIDSQLAFFGASTGPTRVRCVVWGVGRRVAVHAACRVVCMPYMHVDHVYY